MGLPPSHPRVFASGSVRMSQRSLWERPHREALSPLLTCFFWCCPPEDSRIGKPLSVWPCILCISTEIWKHLIARKKGGAYISQKLWEWMDNL